MKTKTAHHEPTEAEIQHVAYHLWIESGRAHGRDLDHWLTARELLRHKTARSASSGTSLRPVRFPSHNLGPTNPPFPT